MQLQTESVNTWVWLLDQFGRQQPTASAFFYIKISFMHMGKLSALHKVLVLEEPLPSHSALSTGCLGKLRGHSSFKAVHN